MVAGDEPPLRLKAAEALGRLGQAQAIPSLCDGLRTGIIDRFLEHAVTYALLRIANRAGTETALKDPNPKVRRAALIALDQMKGGELSRALVAPLLDTDDPDLQQACLDVISRRKGWSDEVLGPAAQWLGEAELPSARRQALTGALLAFCEDDKVQQLVAKR